MHRFRILKIIRLLIYSYYINVDFNLYISVVLTQIYKELTELSGRKKKFACSTSFGCNPLCKVILFKYKSD